MREGWLRRERKADQGRDDRMKLKERLEKEDKNEKTERGWQKYYIAQPLQPSPQEYNWETCDIGKWISCFIFTLIFTYRHRFAYNT